LAHVSTIEQSPAEKPGKHAHVGAEDSDVLQAPLPLQTRPSTIGHSFPLTVLRVAPLGSLVVMVDTPASNDASTAFETSPCN
jgi:hypothetical protein